MADPFRDKRPLDLDLALGRIREAVRPYPKAAVFALADEGFRSPFELVVACVISIRTLDEVTIEAARRLLRRARTPAALRALPAEAVDALIHPCTFHREKAERLREIARIAAEEHGGALPCDPEALRALPGVGPKCAHLVAGIACGLPLLAVDVHVHRVIRRWGLIRSPTPEGAASELERLVPEEHRVELNALLVPFGKHVCTGRLPRCSTCPVLEMCRQIGVIRHR